MKRHQEDSTPALPRQWRRHARAAVLHAISLASTAMTIVRGGRSGPSGEIDALRTEIALLREEIGVKDDRMARLAPARRPHYQPIGRMAILEVRARRG